MTAKIAERTHNEPPSPLDPEFLKADLSVRYRDIEARKDELKAAADRMPEAVEDDSMAAKFVDMGKVVNAAIGTANAARKNEKDPYLNGGRVVDNHFRALIDELNRLKARVQKPLTAYQLKKEEEERKRREAKAREEREEAERLAKEAGDDEALDKAVAADEAAKKAEKDAAASGAELGRARGEYGGVAALRKIWKVEVEDRGKIPLDILKPYFSNEEIEKAARAYMKAVGPEEASKNLPGIRVFQEAKTTF